MEIEERLLELNISQNPPPVKPNESKVNITLPAISLPKFDRNPLKYKSYWDQFDNLVHQQRIANVTKLTHFLSTLHGMAKAALEGLPVTNAS
ncbi:unnamed protein product [Anisakis simplex]|uniref:Reverse transcriptase domain-containing protein n=1 Tax=Anisakis simplex TaxID=6269 RepID=A0A0M3J1N4_ANISI|nr:unnamed protein product [Anisakis simplex]